MSMLGGKPTGEDVRNLYRYLLGRFPESDELVEQWINDAPSLEWLVDRFLTCDEFRLKQHHNLEITPVGDGRLNDLISQLAARHPKRELYQPIYGIKYEHDGPIQRECVERCDLVRDALNGLPLASMSLIDVGCNMGYVSFEMSKSFGKVTGLEYDTLLYEFCIELNRRLKGNVAVKCFDFFSNYKQLAGNADVCLLFSVIHYLVGAKGLKEAKAILKDIVLCFDYVVIELSSSIDYAYMPNDPTEMLVELMDVDCVRLGVSEKNARPVYLLKKKQLAF